MEEKLKVKVILGSVRQGRFGERPARWLIEGLKEWGEIDAELLDLKDYPMPFFDSPVSPAMLGRKYPNEVVQRWADKLNEADAFILISPEYNHSFSAVLKNAIDWTNPEWLRKPVGFVSYGSTGGARAVEHLRGVAIELKAVPINRSVHISWDFIMKAVKNPQVQNSELFAPLRNGSLGQDTLAVFVNDLLWMAKALKGARAGK